MAKKKARVVSMKRTRRAIGQIKNARVRRDLLDQLDGAEFGLARNKLKIAASCASNIRAVAFALSGTLGAKVSSGILEGLWSDSTGTKAARLRPALGLQTHRNSRCVNAQCIAKKGSICWTISGADGGCGSPGGFHFAWQARSAQ